MTQHFLNILLEKMKTLIWKGSCNLMLIAALFTIAKTWKQPKSPSMDEGIKKTWCIFIKKKKKILLIHKKEWNFAICNCMDGPWGHYEISQKDKCELTFMWNLKNKTLSSYIKNRLVVARGKGWGVGEMGEGGQKVQTSSYKINKSWGCNVQHVDYS